MNWRPYKWMLLGIYNRPTIAQGTGSNLELILNQVQDFELVA